MKKYFSLICLLTILSSGCNQEELVNNQSTTLESRTFTASFDQNESRTYIEEGNLLRWTKGDQISMFNGNTVNSRYQFDGETGDNKGTFSWVESPSTTGNNLNCNYAVYPYASDITITSNGIITSTLPTEQTYAENSFGLGMNTMVAVTKDIDDNFLTFKNVSGYLKLQLYGDDVIVKSITLKGNSNEKLAGKANITPVYGNIPTTNMSEDATKTITLNCSEGVKIGTTKETATAFWLVVPPIMFNNGFSITVTDISEKVFIKTTSNAIQIERNVIKPMAAVEIKKSEMTIPNNQIWYTSYIGSAITPNKTSFSGANLISNVYENGKGVMTFDSDITSISYKGFYESTYLETIVIPKSVKSIESNAFYGCELLTNISLYEEGLQKIGSQAFSKCSNLSKLSLPKTVQSIGNYAFEYCSFTEIDIPDGVTSINEGTFSWCEKLSNIILPNSLTTIGDAAFWNCASLKNITIPKNVTSIGTSVFRYCPIENITLPNSITSIGDEAFAECSFLKNVTFGEGVTTFGNGIFAFCESLVSFEGKYITEDKRCLIKDGILLALAESQLEEYTIPSNVTVIGHYAITGDFVKKVTIPDNVVIIEKNAFGWNYSLETVHIGEGVRAINEGAFRYCGNLKKIYCKASTPPVCGTYVFEGINSELIIYVPNESLDAYRSATNWINYSSSIQGFEFTE